MSTLAIIGLVLLGLFILYILIRSGILGAILEAILSDSGGGGGWGGGSSGGGFGGGSSGGGGSSSDW